MNWFALLLILESALVAGIDNAPREAGVYMLRGDAEWVELEPAPVAGARTRGLEMFIETGGYTRFFVDIAFAGEKAAWRTTDRSPRFFFRGPFSPADLLIVRLTPRGGAPPWPDLAGIGLGDEQSGLSPRRPCPAPDVGPGRRILPCHSRGSALPRRIPSGRGRR